MELWHHIDDARNLKHSTDLIGPTAVIDSELGFVFVTAVVFISSLERVNKYDTIIFGQDTAFP